MEPRPVLKREHENPDLRQENVTPFCVASTIAVSPKSSNKVRFEDTRASCVSAEILGAGDEVEEGQILRCPEEPSQEEVENI